MSWGAGTIEGVSAFFLSIGIAAPSMFQATETSACRYLVSLHPSHQTHLIITLKVSYCDWLSSSHEASRSCSNRTLARRRPP